MEIDDDFALVKASPPARFTGKPLGELGIRTNYGVTIIAVHKPGQPWGHTTAETVLEPEDVILITGSTDKAEAFSQLR